MGRFEWEVEMVRQKAIYFIRGFVRGLDKIGNVTLPEKIRIDKNNLIKELFWGESTRDVIVTLESNEGVEQTNLPTLDDLELPILVQLADTLDDNDSIPDGKGD